MTPQQARALANLLTTAREQLGISSRELARRSGIRNSTVSRLELAEVPAPRPDTLKALADALGIDLADVFATAGYAQPDGLPTLTPYLRSKYGDLPAKAQKELERSFAEIARKYGYSPDGPSHGEDETN
jgi:transcriptional regulator with XRE-family HTH domain